MKVLRDHFDGKATILIHDRIINGCEDFTLAEADVVLRENDVPADVWQQVLDVYTGVSTDAEIDGFVNDKDRDVRLAIAQYGNNDHRSLLVKDASPTVRLTVAQYGNNDHRSALLGDNDWFVRRTVTEYGNDDHRSALLNNND